VHKKIVLNKAKRIYISDDLIINLQTTDSDEKGQAFDDSVIQLNDTSDSIMPMDNKSTLTITSYIEPIISQILPTKTSLNIDKETDSFQKYQESETMANENATHTSSLYIEPNSTHEIPIPSSTECMSYELFLINF